jgi:hypothetical protein
VRVKKRRRSRRRRQQETLLLLLLLLGQAEACAGSKGIRGCHCPWHLSN